MNDIERLFEACDEALSSAGMGPTGYEKQDIAAVADGMKCLLVYVRNAHKQVYKELDNPLYKDFVNDATGALADIRLDEITTENTFRMEVHNEIRSAGYPRYVNAVNNKLTILDFMGITEVEAEGGIPVLENLDSVGWFKDVFRMDYEAQGFSRAEVREILKEYVSLGEFDHKGYHPVKGFASRVLDVTIVKPVIEAITGRDMITHERLTDFERGMQGVDAVIGVITLGQGAVAAKVAGEGIFKTVFKTWTVDALSDIAACTVGNICDKNEVPLSLTLVLSTLTGCSVSKKAGKYLLTDMASDAVTEYTLEEVEGILKTEDVNTIVLENIDDVAETAIKGGTATLSGQWKAVNESMSDFSRAYQKQITGQEGMAWVQNGVKFDGMKDGVLIDAKGKYAQFIDKGTGEFYDWFTGKDSLITEARRQVDASEGAKIQWYFAEEECLNVVQDLFMGEGITEIELIFEAPK